MIQSMATSSSTTAAISARGLTKRYGSTVALDSLDLPFPRGGVRVSRSRRCREDDDDPAAARPSAGPSGLPRCSVRTRGGIPSGCTGKLAYVAGEPQLWPALTGWECLQFLGQLHGSVDGQYRQTLIARFQFEPHKRVRDYSKGNRQKIQLIAAFATRPELLILDEPTSGLDPLMEAALGNRRRGAWRRVHGVPLVAHSQRGRGAVRSRRHPRPGQAGRGGDPGRTAASLPARGRGDVLRGASRDRPPRSHRATSRVGNASLFGARIGGVAG